MFFGGCLSTCAFACLRARMPSMKGNASSWLPKLKPNFKLTSRKTLSFYSLIRVKPECEHELRNTNKHVFSLFVSSVQKLQTFQSLSCPGFSATDGFQSGLAPPTFNQSDSDFSAVSELGLESRQEVEGDDEEEDSSFEELDSDSACSVDSRPGSPVGIVGGKRTLWKGGTQRDIFQLGGELDLDQIERN